MGLKTISLSGPSAVREGGGGEERGEVAGGHLTSSIKELSVIKRTKKCAFCWSQKAKYKCRSCGAHLCITKPIVRDDGRDFLSNGASCYLWYHVTNVFPHG